MQIQIMCSLVERGVDGKFIYLWSGALFLYANSNNLQFGWKKGGWQISIPFQWHPLYYMQIRIVCGLVERGVDGKFIYLLSGALFLYANSNNVQFGWKKGRGQILIPFQCHPLYYMQIRIMCGLVERGEDGKFIYLVSSALFLYVKSINVQFGWKKCRG